MQALRVPFPRRVFGRALEKVYLQDGILYMLYRKKKEMRLYDFDEIVRMGQIRNSPDSEPILEITGRLKMYAIKGANSLSSRELFK